MGKCGKQSKKNPNKFGNMSKNVEKKLQRNEKNLQDS